MTRLRRGVLAALAVLGVLLAPSIAPAAEEDLRRLLAELWIQVPSREASAPPFSLPDLSGTPVRLADHKGRPVMLYFWTTY
jgi:cytochrome oxidase Cu insertion factor (SCO1/SenC/PrrC family)